MSRMTDEELATVIAKEEHKHRKASNCSWDFWANMSEGDRDWMRYRAVESEARRRAIAETIERIGSHKVCDCTKQQECPECNTLEWAIGCIQDIMREDTIQRHAQEE